MKLHAASATTKSQLHASLRYSRPLSRAVADHALPWRRPGNSPGYRGRAASACLRQQTYDADSARRHTRHVSTIAASLTKPVVTATLVAMQVEAGRIGLDLPVARYIPEWNSGPNPDWRKRVTVRQLLTHSLRDFPRTRTTSLRRTPSAKSSPDICNEPLEYEPGTKTVYSDLGFILLGEILERATGKTVDQLALEQIFAPLDMHDTMFKPSKTLLSRIAPTENDTTFRKRLIQGEVHDENAFAMGGVAGHAGMFATAPDLAAFCQMLLNGGMYAQKRRAHPRDDFA